MVAAVSVSVLAAPFSPLPRCARRLLVPPAGPPPEGAEGAVIVRMSSIGRPSTTAEWAGSRAF